MRALNIVSSSPEQTLALAKKLADSFTDQDILVLSGELGSGKTQFVKGLAQGRGLDLEKVSSPSYTFVNEYPGDKPLYHFDLYRLIDPVELYEIGFEEYLQREGLVVIEWGEKAGELLPERYYLMEFEITDDNTREMNLSLVQR